MHPFKKWIISKELIQREVAEDIGVTPSYLSQVINYFTPPSSKLAIRIEKYTNGAVNIRDLLMAERRQYGKRDGMHQMRPQ